MRVDRGLCWLIMGVSTGLFIGVYQAFERLVKVYQGCKVHQGFERVNSVLRVRSYRFLGFCFRGVFWALRVCVQNFAGH